MDPLVLVPEVDRATGRLERTVAALDDAQVVAPSLLPGWTRGHVLTHLARHADACINLLTWARTGVVTPAYPDPKQRESDIAAGAPRPLAQQLADVRESAARFAAAAQEMAAEAWTAVLDIPGAPQPAARVVWRRLREVEVHHVDLAAGYAPADWPEAFSRRLLRELVADFTDRPAVPALVLRADGIRQEMVLGHPQGTTTVTGPAHLLAGWLAGRTDGTGLSVSPHGPPPTPPDWM